MSLQGSSYNDFSENELRVGLESSYLENNFRAWMLKLGVKDFETKRIPWEGVNWPDDVGKKAVLVALPEEILSEKDILAATRLFHSLGSGVIIGNSWNVNDLASPIHDSMKKHGEETEEHHESTHTSQERIETFVSELNNSIAAAQLLKQQVSMLELAENALQRCNRAGHTLIILVVNPPTSGNQTREMEPKSHPNSSMDQAASSDHHVIDILNNDAWSVFEVPTIDIASKSMGEDNRNYFTPVFVSIGPLHHGHWAYDDMEAVKRKILDNILKETGTSYASLANVIGVHEDKLRACYKEIPEMVSDNFLKMMITDAVFIIYGSDYNYGMNVSRRITQQTVDDIKQDLLLWENQLPSVLLKMVFVTLNGGSMGDCSTKGILTNILMNLLPDNMSLKNQLGRQRRNATTFQPSHLLDLLRFYDLDMNPPSTGRSTPNPVSWELLYNATKLDKSGVKIKGVRGPVSFQSNGEFHIPSMEIITSSGTMYRNIMAFESSIYPKKSFVCEKIFLLDSLMRGGDEDEQLLVQKKVIINKLGDNEAPREVIREICKSDNILKQSDLFGCDDLCKVVNKFCDGPLGKMKRVLRNKNLEASLKNSLLILTLMQTIIALLAYLNDISAPQRCT